VNIWQHNALGSGCHNDLVIGDFRFVRQSPRDAADHVMEVRRAHV
jgi:hypothetical protein